MNLKKFKYIERTRTCGILPGQDNFFNSITVPNKLKSLFPTRQCKDSFNFPIKHDVEILALSYKCKILKNYENNF